MALITVKALRQPRIDALGNGFPGKPSWLKYPPPIGPLPAGAVLRGWLFGGSEDCLLDTYHPDHDKIVVPVSLPTYTQNSLIISAASVQWPGIELPVVDAVPMTIIVVIRNKTYSGNAMLVSTATPEHADLGWNIFQLHSLIGIDFRTRGVNNAAGDQGGADRYDQTAIPESRFLILGMSQTATSRVTFVHGLTNVQNSGSGTRTGLSITPSGRPVVLGNIGFSGYGNSPEFAAVFHADKASSAADFAAVTPSILRAMAKRRVPMFRP